jgi:heterodisulfide reductase subunit C
MFDLAEANAGLWKDVFSSDEPLRCFNCSTCIAGCPASEADPPLLIRNLVRKVIIGLEDDLVEDDTPWVCVTCSRCQEMCPQDVKPFEVILALRRWQCRKDETRIPPVLPELYERGYTQPVDAGAIRVELGLDPHPAIYDHPDLLKSFQAMLMEVGIVKDNAYMFGGGR